MNSRVHDELKGYLINTGFTFNAEGEPLGVPTVVRQVNVDVLINEVIDFLTTAGYLSPYKITVE